MPRARLTSCRYFGRWKGEGAGEPGGWSGTCPSKQLDFATNVLEFPAPRCSKWELLGHFGQFGGFEACEVVTPGWSMAP